ncbi:MAG: NADH-quinone oxidoreductase subunit NuoN [Rhodobacteraceae bacterium]|nr:NADH-quinone oxidoreductase subunit NuoN [Paracoccaceae bacterium]
MLVNDVILILPELILAIYAAAALLWGVFVRHERIAGLLVWMTSAVMIGLGLWIGLAATGVGTAFNGSFIDDAYARFAKVVVLLSAGMVLMTGHDFLQREGILKFEYPILVAFAVVGMMVMVSASDLIVLYMGIEMQALALYVLTAMHRDNAHSTEAGLKYFVLGALSSGILLYGASFLYGFAGTTDYAGIAVAGSEDASRIGLLFGLAFMIVGLAFKVSAAPFHMWAPDVYEGAPTPVTALIATAPKIAAIMVFARLLVDTTGIPAADWQPIIAIIATISMFLGAFAAIRQTNIKRLIAYSSIAHMGYALIGLAAGTAEGIAAMLTYMVIYILMSIGTFAFIMSMRQNGRPVASIYAFNRIASQAPVTALSLLLLMFSLAGIVPMIGFFAKLAVFWAAVSAGMIWLAVAGGIASVIGAYYYLRLVYFMYFGEEGTPLDTDVPRFGLIVLAVAAGAMLIGVVNLFGIPEFSTLAVHDLLH